MVNWDKAPSAFLKAEAYQKVSDPRGITSFNTVNKREYSRFIYALAELISTQPWYAFGKTPKEIAETVADICVDAKLGVCCGDLSRQDGHISIVLRLLDTKLLTRTFTGEFTEQVLDLQAKFYDTKVYTKHGVKYKIDWERGSGEPPTALFNTCSTKFIDYFSRRLSGVSPREAFEAKGLFGGDDSITSSISEFSFGVQEQTQAAESVGQKLEVITYRKGVYGVNFLSRYYGAAVWFGAPDSTCDLARALSKIHVAVKGFDCTDLRKFEQKISGLAFTDRNTPIIKQIITAAVKVGCKIDLPYDSRYNSYWCKFIEEVNWPNCVSEDDAYIVDQFLPTADCTQLFGYLELITESDQILKMPSIVCKDDVPHKFDPKGDGSVVVDDDVLDKRLNALLSSPTIPNINSLCSQIDGAKQPSIDSYPPIKPVPASPLLKPASPICDAYILGDCKDNDCGLGLHIVVCRSFATGKCKRNPCKFPHSYKILAKQA
jgi:hypothetical protein